MSHDTKSSKNSILNFNLTILILAILQDIIFPINIVPLETILYFENQILLQDV